MAQLCIESIQKIRKERNTIHEKVPASFSVFDSDGRKYFQIDTYGRLGRENPEKISQSLQLDREAAVFLVRLLSQEFNIV
jgi:hypothetical protein